MKAQRISVAVLFAILLIVGMAGNSLVAAQSSDQQPQAKADETNLDTQLYLILATNQEVPAEKTPAALDTVLKQLRSTLPFKNYRVSTTLINRVKNDGRLNLKWIGGPLLATAAATATTPSFNEFKVNNVKVVRDQDGQPLVRMEGFGFGARIPIQSGTAMAANGTAPVINYEPTGLNTDISMREGEAVIVGTLNVGPSGDAIILVISAKRSSH